MAHSRTARKAVRQNSIHRARNRWRWKAMRDDMKEFNEQVLHGTAKAADEAYAKCVSIIDRSAGRGVIHKNQASRRKSRLYARLVAKSKPAAAKAK